MLYFIINLFINVVLDLDLDSEDEDQEEQKKLDKEGKRAIDKNIERSKCDHYHLQVQATWNSHLGLSRSLRPKEADFEAEIFFLLKQII